MKKKLVLEFEIEDEKKLSSVNRLDNEEILSIKELLIMWDYLTQTVFDNIDSPENGRKSLTSIIDIRYKDTKEQREIEELKTKRPPELNPEDNNEGIK